MVDFIRIEPSADIHLVMDPAFRSNGGVSLTNLEMKIWAAEAATLPDGNAGYSFTDVSAACSFDFTPGQTVVLLTTGSTISPRRQGETFMQVRYTDPANPDNYHYLVVRIMVHLKMDTWWFGNDSLSVMKDPDLPHSQPSIYASFDNGRVIADITGHNYVTLISNNPAKFTIANNAAKPYSGRIQGIDAGLGFMEGLLMGKSLTLPVTVIDFAMANNKVLDPLLVNRVISPKERYNMLFISEGFTDRTIYNGVCQRIKADLFNNTGAVRHSPYNILEDDLNIWTTFQRSADEGITTGFRIASMGLPIPIFDAAPNNKFSGLKALTLQVGLSDTDLLGRGVTAANIATRLPAVILALRAAWRVDATAIALGYVDATTLDDTIRDWIIQTPMNAIPQTRDTYYGFIAGNRPGEKASSLMLKNRPDPANAANIIHSEEWVTAGHANFRPHEFTRRTREWLIPNDSNLAFPPLVDSRRYAPEIYDFGNRDKWVIYLVKKHIVQFNDASATPVDGTITVGQYWDKAYVPAPASQEIKSDGLVCFLINSALKGRSLNYMEYFVGTIVGSLDESYIDTSSTAPSGPVVNMESLPDGTLKMRLTPTIVIDYRSLISTVAHEFGHSFNLGDEYEEFQDAATPAQLRSFDNLVHYVRVIRVGAAPNNFAKPIVPAQLPWSVLHRVLRSFSVVETATFTAVDTITLKVRATDIPLLLRAKADDQRIYIRRMVSSFAAQNGKQLRDRAQTISARDIFTELEIVDNSIDATLNQVTLRTTATSLPAQFPTAAGGASAEDILVPFGSILYVPRRDAALQPVSVIRQPVMDYMSNTSYGGTVPNGRAITENYDETSTLPEMQRIDPPAFTADIGVAQVSRLQFFFPYRIIGAYEGGARHVTQVYRPAGACKMRNSFANFPEGGFCFVCKYLIVSRVNPSKLARLDREYPIF